MISSRKELQFYIAADRIMSGMLIKATYKEWFLRRYLPSSSV